MHSSSAVLSDPAAPAAPPLPANALRRRAAQRVFVKDRPEAICQLQINEIAKLSEQLASAGHQPLPADHPRRRALKDRPQDANQTLKHILLTGQAYRSELLASQQRRAQEARQSAVIQREVEALSREREAMAAEIGNERSKNSILEQELFMARDAFQKYRSRMEAEKTENVQELKALRGNLAAMEGVVRDLSAKAALLPFYEVRVGEGEARTLQQGQELQQVRGELRYFQEKSTYFQTNYTVLNDNFNSLYATNLALTAELKDAKAALLRSEAAVKSLEEEGKRLNSQCLELSQEKNKLISQLNGEIALLGERIKGENRAVGLSEKVNEQLNSSLEEARRATRELESRKEQLEREAAAKSGVIATQKALNEQLQATLRDLEASITQKEDQWRATLATEILRLGTEHHHKALSLTAELAKTQEAEKTLTAGLSKSEEKASSLREKTFELERQLDAALRQAEQRQRVGIALRGQVEESRVQSLTLRNCIKDYQNKLNAALSLQEQLTATNRLTLDDKTAKIKELQAKIEELSTEKTDLQLTAKDLLEEISKLTEVSGLLRAEVEAAREEQLTLEQRMGSETKLTEWLTGQSKIKDQIIAKYSALADELRAKAAASEGELAERTERQEQLEEELAQSQEKLKGIELLLIEQTRTEAEQEQQLQAHTQQAQKLKAIVLALGAQRAQLLHRNEELGLSTVALLEKLTHSQSALVAAEKTLKETVEGLHATHGHSLQKLKQQHSHTLKQLQQNSQIENEQKAKEVEALTLTLAELQRTINAEKEENQRRTATINQLSTQLRNNEDATVKLSAENDSAWAETATLKAERLQMAQLIEMKSETVQKLKVSLLELDETYRASCEEAARKHEQRIAALTAQLDAQGQAAQRWQQRTSELEAQLATLTAAHADCSTHLESQQLKVQNSIFQGQVLSKEVQKLTEQRDQMAEEGRQLRATLTQSVWDSHLQVTSLAQEVESLRQENVHLQAHAQSLSSQVQALVRCLETERRAKSELAESASGAEGQAKRLEWELGHAREEAGAMQAICDELRQERDLLIRKYISLSNQLAKVKPAASGLEEELESFAQSFSRISLLHTQINRHLHNILQDNARASSVASSAVRGSQAVEKRPQ